jgi:uncharacterized protein
MKKLLILSDLHDVGIPYTHDQIMDCDIVICLGDCTPEDLAPLKDIIIPKIGIHGNHDTIREGEKDWFEDLGIQNIHLKIVKIEGITFLGFDGCMKYGFAESIKIDNPAMKACRVEMQKLVDMPQADCLLTHYPAFGILDNPKDTAHRGLKAFSQYIKTKKPKYHFFGHMHTPKKAQINYTKAQCIYQANIIKHTI